jgi:CRISPR-associated protein Csc2
VKDTVIAGLAERNERPMRRVVISKRKQTAVERRTGRELLREYDLLHTKEVKGRSPQVCALNTNAPCERCIDCYVYGFAAGGGGAQKSRVITDDAYSIGPAAQVTERRTFNATFDTGTMRSPLTGQPSTSINEDEFVRPGVHFLDIESLKDLTLGELIYVLGNVLRSTRYGAISSRMGRVTNTIGAIIFTDREVFSNLELTQAVYDQVCGQDDEPPFPLGDRAVAQSVQDAIDLLMPRVVSREPRVLRGSELDALVEQVTALYRSPDLVGQMLRATDAAYPKA